MPLFSPPVLFNDHPNTLLLIFRYVRLLKQQTEKAIAVYPNSGEIWDGRAKRWLVSRGYFLQFTDTFDR
jgi:S-methylmethionine-dependent homocysteine/selenocysteine methylase